MRKPRNVTSNYETHYRNIYVFFIFAYKYGAGRNYK